MELGIYLNPTPTIRLQCRQYAQDLHYYNQLMLDRPFWVISLDTLSRARAISK